MRLPHIQSIRGAATPPASLLLRLGGTALVCLSAAHITACNLAVDIDAVQCKTDEDCQSRGDAFVGAICRDSVCETGEVEDPRTSCIGNPPPPPTDPGPFEVKLPLTDLVNQEPLTDVAANLCRKVDVTCADPVTTTMSDSKGVLNFTVANAFTGFVAMTSPAIVPTNYFLNPAIDRSQTVTLALVSPASRQGIIGLLGADGALGDILLSTEDCTGGPVEGARLSIAPDDGTIIGYYLQGGLPSSEEEATDATGYGGFVGIHAGSYTVTATLEDDTVLGKVTVVVEEGTVAWSRVVPNGG